MTIRALQESVRSFAVARDWEQFHTPRNLLIALTGEVGEVCELLQWIPDIQVDAWLDDSKNREKLGLELADVLSYLLRLSDVCGIDLEVALTKKMAINESRYPVESSRGSSAKYTKLNMPQSMEE